MGQAHGEQCREAIREFAARRLEVCVKQAETSGWPDPREDVLAFCQVALGAHEAFAPDVHEEFLGIAEGADLSPDRLLVCNGLTDVIDAFRSAPVEGLGCTSWLAAPEATLDGHVLAGQTWDMHAWAEEYVVILRRKPVGAPASLTLTTTGCLSLIGINEAGIAVGNNNLTPTDAKPGVMYLAMIHQALAQTSIAAAVNEITAADRMSGHNYYLAGAEGEIVDVETTAALAEVILPGGSIYAHANHYLTPDLASLEAEAPGASTLQRLERMGHLLHAAAGEITWGSMFQAMSDQTGPSPGWLCRTDPSDVARTCAAIVMSPEEGRLWAVQGPPCSGSPACFEL